MRITKVYTKTGDDGSTGLVGGQRVPKHDPRIEAYGTVDELAAALGVARVELAAEKAAFTDAGDTQRFTALLEFLGNMLFTLGGDLATRSEDRHPQMPVILPADVAWLERACDAYNDALPPLKDFVLPGGSRTAAQLHVARTIARRAERAACALAEREEAGLAVVYLNRLSDLLFVLARWTNARLGIAEPIWRRELPEPSLPAA